MPNYFLIAGNLATLAGVFTNKADLLAAAKMDDDAVVVTNPVDIAEALTEPQMRRVRADVSARLQEDIEDGESDYVGAALFRSDERFNTKAKKPVQAKRLYDDLLAFAGSPQAADMRSKTPAERKPAEKKAVAPRQPRRNIKRHIRSLLAEVGATVSYDQVAQGNPEDAEDLYSDVSITTAMSDLRSEKYCGEGGPLVIKRLKHADGTVSFLREA